VKDFRQLKVWEKAHQLTLNVYQSSRAFPKDELYGMTSQVRRSASSIPANIAEGCGRGSDAEMARFCRIGLGSASELEYHLLLAHDLGYLDENKYQTIVADVYEVKRMLVTFEKTLAKGVKSANS
jgi:four helix bundle protein